MLQFSSLIISAMLITGCASSPRLIPNEIKHSDSISEYKNPKQSLFPSQMQSTIEKNISRSFTTYFNQFFENREPPSKEIGEVLRDNDGRVMRFSEKWVYKANKIDSKWKDSFVFKIYGYPSAEKKKMITA